MELTIADLKPFLPGLEKALDDEAVSEVMVNGPATVYVERGDRVTPIDAPGADRRGGLAGGDPDRPPAGRGPGHGPDHRRAARGRLPSRRVQPAGGAGDGDYDPPLRRPGVHHRGADRERVAAGGRGRAGRGLLDHGRNVLISGGTGSGKTTLLNAPVAFCRPRSASSP